MKFNQPAFQLQIPIILVCNMMATANNICRFATINGTWKLLIWNTLSKQKTNISSITVKKQSTAHRSSKIMQHNNASSIKFSVKLKFTSEEEANLKDRSPHIMIFQILVLLPNDKINSSCYFIHCHNEKSLWRKTSARKFVWRGT